MLGRRTQQAQLDQAGLTPQPTLHGAAQGHPPTHLPLPNARPSPPLTSARPVPYASPSPPFAPLCPAPQGGCIGVELVVPAGGLGALQGEVAAAGGFCTEVEGAGAMLRHMGLDG